MTTLSTRVAIAIGRHFRDPKLPQNDDALAVLFEGAAEAAISEFVAAVSEPSDAMLQAGRVADYDGRAAVWQAMLDEALK